MDYTGQLKSKKVLMNEFLATAKAVKNLQHELALEHSIEYTDALLKVSDNPTPEQEEMIRKWLNYE